MYRFYFLVLISGGLFGIQNPINPGVPVEIAEVDSLTEVAVSAATNHNVIAWIDEDQVLSSVSTNLSSGWGEEQLIADGLTNPQAIEAASNASGTLVVFMAEDDPESDSVALVGIFYDAQTETWGSPYTITPSSGNGSTSRVFGLCADESRFAISWQSQEGFLAFSTSEDGASWTGPLPMPPGSPEFDAIALTVYDGLYLMSCASGGSIIFALPSDDLGATWGFADEINGSFVTSSLSNFANNEGFYVATIDSDESVPVVFFSPEPDEWEAITGPTGITTSDQVHITGNSFSLALTARDQSSGTPYVFYTNIEASEWSGGVEIDTLSSYGVPVSATEEDIIFGSERQTPDPRRIYSNFSRFPNSEVVANNNKESNTYIKIFQPSIPSKRGFTR